MKNILGFTTARIKARQMTPGDLDDLADLHQNQAVMATMGGMRDRVYTGDTLEKYLSHYDTYGFGYWIFEDKVTGAFVGRGGLLKVIIGGVDEIAIGCALLPEFWGKGIATEIAQKLIHIGFEELGLSSLAGYTLLDNMASQRVLDKVGFSFEKECTIAELPHRFYRLTKKQWESK